MFPSSTCSIVSACFLQYLSLFYANLDNFFCSVFYFVANITHLFQKIKCTLHVIAGAYIVLVQNLLMCNFKISYDKTYCLFYIAHVACRRSCI